MFPSGSAGIRQPYPRGRGAVEGHDGPTGESGGRLAQADPPLNLLSRLFSQRTADAMLFTQVEAVPACFPPLGLPAVPYC